MWKIRTLRCPRWFLRDIWRPLLIVLFPSECPLCLKPLDGNHLHGICLYCWASIEPVTETFHFKRSHFSRVRSLGIYRGSLKHVIHHFKFSKKAYLSRSLADLLIYAIDIKKTMGPVDMIMAVPLHRKRRKERGFNPSFLIASRIGKKLHIKVEKHLLLRIKHSVPQVDLPAHQREKNVKGAFKVKKPQKIKGKRILLIDDVITTGATVNECARVLKKAGSREVLVLTIAHTPHE